MSYDKSVIFDLDGTLACTQTAYMGMDCPDTWCWTKFEERMDEAPTIEHVVDLWAMYAGLDYHQIVLTARPDHLRESTVDWLHGNGIFCDNLIMMDQKTFDLQETGKTVGAIMQVQSDFKREILVDLKLKHNIVAAYDDSMDNIKMFREMGILAFHVENVK